MWSPSWHFNESDFAATAKSFYNPDFVSTVIHSYRHRYANALGDPALERLEQRLATKPKIHVPAIILEGEDDQVDPPHGSEGLKAQFKGYCEYRLLSRVGHCVPAEAATAVAQAIEDVLRISKGRVLEAAAWVKD